MINEIIKNLKQPEEKNNTLILLYINESINFIEFIKGVEAIEAQTGLKFCYSSNLIHLEILQEWRDKERREIIKNFRESLSKDKSHKRPLFHELTNYNKIEI